MTDGPRSLGSQPARSQVGLVTVAAFGGFACFFVLLPAVPLMADSLGGPFAAGLVTGILTLGAIVAQLLTPRMLKWIGYKTLFQLGLVLLGLPALAYGVAADTLGLVIVITAVRGLGFGILTVVPPALIASTASDAQRSSLVSAYGFSVALAGTLGPPFGLVLFEVGVSSAAITAGALAMASVVILALNHVREPDVTEYSWNEIRYREEARAWDLGRPLVAWLPGAVLFGAFYSFVPLWVTTGGTIAIGAFGLGFALGRLMAGKRGSSTHPLNLVQLGGVLAAVGMAGVFVDVIGLVVVGSAVAGFGVGLMSISALLAALETVKSSHYPIATAAWAISFDGGIALGGLMLGFLVALAGYEAAFAVGVSLLLVGVMVARGPARVNHLRR